MGSPIFLPDSVPSPNEFCSSPSLSVGILVVALCEAVLTTGILQFECSACSLALPHPLVHTLRYWNDERGHFNRRGQLVGQLVPVLVQRSLKNICYLND